MTRSWALAGGYEGHNQPKESGFMPDDASLPCGKIYVKPLTRGKNPFPKKF
jgi:hypothetical protein